MLCVVFGLKSNLLRLIISMVLYSLFIVFSLKSIVAYSYHLNTVGAIVIGGDDNDYTWDAVLLPGGGLGLGITTQSFNSSKGYYSGSALYVKLNSQGRIESSVKINFSRPVTIYDALLVPNGKVVLVGDDTRYHNVVIVIDNNTHVERAFTINVNGERINLLTGVDMTPDNSSLLFIGSSHGYRHLWVVKTDLDFNVEWSATYYMPPVDYPIPFSLAFINDTIVAIAGYGYYSSGWIIYLNSTNGLPIKANYYSSPPIRIYHLDSYNGTIAFTGLSKINGTTVGILGLTSLNGSISWSKLIGAPGSTNNWLMTASFTPMGDIIAAGYIDKGTDNDTLILKFHGNGTLEWVKQYDIGGDEWVYTILMDEDRIYAIGGVNMGPRKTDAMIAVLNREGAAASGCFNQSSFTGTISNITISQQPYTATQYNVTSSTILQALSYTVEHVNPAIQVICHNTGLVGGELIPPATEPLYSTVIIKIALITATIITSIYTITVKKNKTTH